MKVLVVGGMARSLVDFRGPLLRELVGRGHEVVTAAGEPEPETTEALAAWGIRFVPIRIARAGTRPLQDLATLRDLAGLLRRDPPDLVLAYTVKPVIWTGLVARWRRVPSRHALITGLGYGFGAGSGWRGRLVGGLVPRLYRQALKGCGRVFFQNPDDEQEFLDRGLVTAGQAVRVNGTGVDLDAYRPLPWPRDLSVLMACRLLADKGVREFAAVARDIHRHPPPGNHGQARFRLAGPPDPHPNAIRAEELETWTAEGALDYLGEVRDIRDAIREAAILALPSYYREGVPRSLLEGMACARAVVTADTPGCRETVPLTPQGEEQQRQGEPVMEGENGYRVAPRSADALARALRRCLADPERTRRMGRRSREIAEARFDIRRVNATLIREMGL